MITKALRILVALAVCLAAAGTQAQDRSTPAEAVAMVKKAVAYYKAHGREKTMAEINSPSGQFRSGDLYVVASELPNATVLAHAVNPRMVGKETIDMKDADGKQFVHEMVEVVKTKGSGWVDHRWINHQTKKIELKSAYLERVGEVFFLCGVYKD